jgi:hypothetical protein
MKQSLLFFSIICVLCTQCTTPKIAVSETGWNNKQEFKVKGRQGILIKQKLSFGNYATNTVKRSWTKGNSSRTGIGTMVNDAYHNIISVEYINKKQTIRFSLTDDKQQQSDVYCATKFAGRDLQIGKRPNSIINIAEDILGVTSQSTSFFYVQIYTDDKAGPWQLLLDNQAAQARAKTYQGVLALDKDNYYTIKPVYKMATKKGNQPILGGSIGFEIFNTAQQPVAAVSLIDNGMVFLNSTSDKERFLLANLCAAILLQQEID